MLKGRAGRATRVLTLVRTPLTTSLHSGSTQTHNTLKHTNSHTHSYTNMGVFTLINRKYPKLLTLLGTLLIKIKFSTVWYWSKNIALYTIYI